MLSSLVDVHAEITSTAATIKILGNHTGVPSSRRFTDKHNA